MKNFFLLSCVVLGIFSVTVNSDIVAVDTDFVIDCGTVTTGPQTITYTRTLGNTVYKIYGKDNEPTCMGTDPGTGVYEITDVGTNCVLTQLPGSTDYLIQIALKETSEVIRTTDPVFIFRCTYKVGETTATGTITDAGTVQPLPPSMVILETQGDPDMIYTIQIMDQSSQPLTTATFGNSIILQVTMSGTDADEVGVRVKSLVVKSGGVNVTIVEDFCVLADKLSLAENFAGFYSKDQTASLPITVFGLEGSTSSQLDFECVVEVCSATCDGQNCPAPAGRRRRAAEDEESTADKSLRMSTGIQILPVAIQTSSNSNGQGDSSSFSCMQSMGFIVTVAILGILLVLAMVVVVVLFTSRRRELQKQGA